MPRANLRPPRSLSNRRGPALKTETPPPASPGNVRVWTYGYFPTGLLRQVVTPDGITLDYAYDARSFLTSVTDNLGQSITYAYDAHKNVIRTDTTSADATLALTRDSVYDTRNRLTETRAPHLGLTESVTTRLLDANSNLVGLIDPNGSASSNAYDAFNRLATNTHRESGVTHYTYDDQDRIVEVIAPNGVTTAYEYDIISRRTKELSPDRGTVSYSYDLANNVTTITDGRGITATMTYDALERVATKTYPRLRLPAKNEDVVYTYDACPFGLGRLCARDDESGAYDYTYDAFGNATTMNFTEREGTPYSMGYVYDEGDNVIQTTLPSGRVLDYSRDGVRRVAAIDTTLNGLPQPIVGAIRYRGDNQMTAATYGNGLTDTRSYDLQGRLTHQRLETPAAVPVDERTYHYDANSNILAINTNVENNAYRYDRLDRIVGDAIDANASIDYTYDLNDNRLTVQANAGNPDARLRYAAASNRLASQETLDFATTPTPFIPAPLRDLVYNDVGRLYQLYEDGVLKAEYLYNDEGQRTRKVVHAPGGGGTTVTIYHYDQMGYLVTETQSNGTFIRDYIWQEGMHPLAQIDSTAGVERIVYLYTDHLMTNRLATDAAQAVVWRWEGEAFGNTPAQEFAGVRVNLRFPGQYFDAESNLHYNWNRYYDPTLGRYITSDPIGLSVDRNSYSYSAQNPIVRADPKGLVWQQRVLEEIVLEVACEIARNSLEKQREKWERSIDETTLNKIDAADDTYESDMKNCRLKKCEAERNTCEYLAWWRRHDSVRDAKSWREERRRQNPFDMEPACMGSPESPDDRTRRRRR